MTMQRYWVIGGQYACLEFKDLRSGAPATVVGPFADHDAAKQVWKRLSSEHSSSATARFSIAAEQITLPN